MSPARAAAWRTAVRLAWLRLCLALACLNAAATANAAEPSRPLQLRSAQLIALFKGETKPEEMFTPAFLAAVPSARLLDLTQQLLRQGGPVQTVTRIDPKGDTSATLSIAFERGTASADLVLEPNDPNRISGLWIGPLQPKGDTLAKVMQDLWALPGQTSLAIARLDGTAAPAFSISHKAEQPMAVGSTFKLFILAELNREIRAGKRRWSDVVTLDRRSIPTGILQTWPQDAPLTLHTLAALMISQSDNSATDTLLGLIGRERVEAMLPRLGIAQPDKLRPLLSTREAALLKAGAEALRPQWEAGTLAQRRTLLAGPLASIPADKVDIPRLEAAPTAIETVEWLASTSDLVRTMNWLRLNGDAQTHQLLAINPGIPAALARNFAFVGYKGGSETGVLNATFLLRGKDGTWRALSATWNNPAGPIRPESFFQLVGRAVALLK